MIEPSTINSVKDKFKALKMKACVHRIEEVIQWSLEKNRTSLEVIDHLLEIELEAKRKNKIERYFKESKLTDKLTIDSFDFNFDQSRIKQKTRILNLINLEFIRQRKDVIFIGNPGLGKTYLAKSLAYSATQAGVKVLFTTAMDMLNHLIAAEADHSLLKKLHYYQSPELLICDEIGYLSLGTQGSNLFFQVISARHEKKSTIITTNLPFSDWGKIFDGTTIATAIADRLVANSEIFILEGESYRKKINR